MVKPETENTNTSKNHVLLEPDEDPALNSGAFNITPYVSKPRSPWQLWSYKSAKHVNLKTLNFTRGP